MTSRRWTRPFAPFALVLAAFAALPSLEWCPFRWSECAAPCDVAAVPPCAEAAAGCPVAAACSVDPECDATAAPHAPESGPIPANERAWCIHPPFDGVVVRDVGLDRPDAVDLPAIPIARVELDAPRESTSGRIERSPPSPVLIAAHAPPLSRAPPSA